MRPVIFFLFALPLFSAALRAQDSPHADWKNLAAGREVKFVTPPNEPTVTDPDDAAQLVDGLFSRATPTMWHGPEAVGWIQQGKVEFVVDLGQDEPIRGVALRAGAGESGVAWPDSILVFVSADGDAYSPAGDIMKLMSDRPGETGYQAAWLTADDLKTHGRYVKFVVAPGDSGNGVYFFLDELEIYRGEDDWLKVPLPSADLSSVGQAAPALGRNVAKGAQVEFQTKPNDPDVSDGPDDLQLVDGEISTAEPIWTDHKVVGWRGTTPVEFTVDLGAVQQISGVAAHLAAGISGVEWPVSLAVEVSEDGSEFTPIGDLMELSKKRPPAADYAALWLVAGDLTAHGRYLKFRCQPADKGNGAYLYLDEVEVYSDAAKAP